MNLSALNNKMNNKLSISTIFKFLVYYIPKIEQFFVKNAHIFASPYSLPEIKCTAIEFLLCTYLWEWKKFFIVWQKLNLLHIYAIIDLATHIIYITVASLFSCSLWKNGFVGFNVSLANVSFYEMNGWIQFQRKP